jgi:hypothetical protein
MINLYFLGGGKSKNLEEPFVNSIEKSKDYTYLFQLPGHNNHGLDN